MGMLHRRIGRIGYTIASVPFYALLLFLLLSQPDHRWSLEGHPERVVITMLIVGWEMCFAALRCHDFGKPFSWDFWTNQIPIVGGLISMWELHFKAGDPKRNAYGPIPRL